MKQLFEGIVTGLPYRLPYIPPPGMRKGGAG
jgi:hypothetical protein